MPRPPLILLRDREDILAGKLSVRGFRGGPFVAGQRPGQQVFGGAIGRSTGSVAQGGGEGRPAPLFASAWSFDVGSTQTIVRDNNKWDMWDNNTQDLSVVSASGLGAPSGMANVLRHTFDTANPTRAAYVRIVQKFAALSIGETLYVRFYYRQSELDEGNSGLDNSHHNFEGDNRTTVKSVVLFKPGNNLNGTYPLRWLLEEADTSTWGYLTPNAQGQTLPKNKFHRWEIAITRTDGSYLGLAFRLYDPDDDATLLYQDGATGLTKMMNNAGGGGALLSTAPSTAYPYSNIDWLRSWELGNNGGSMGPFSVNCYDYFAGVCFRTDDWCGPYSTTDG